MPSAWRYANITPSLVEERLRKKKTWDWSEITRVTAAVTSSVSKNQVSAAASNPFDFVARLHLPIYLTAHYLDFLPQAMNRLDPTIRPQIAVCPWNNLIEDEYTLLAGEPSALNPWVFHIYGRCNSPESLVLTEDDFFDYLIGITKNSEKIATRLKGALVKTSLLFLGFRVDLDLPGTLPHHCQPGRLAAFAREGACCSPDYAR